ncbi:MAG TPA: site-specific integrase [Oligoflexus sp.]|uniref:tyrosine-type recombinase/integrase n=1 Tax=Oligoflexus sp. TaxID=1971216 RepID=UPI002D7EE099|nr:site-specific integrase [Oligoflexus sp.]HET9240520.1 site-specific integrase [Oligoflexus sp.]
MKFKDFASYWLETHACAHKEIGSVKGDRQMLRDHLVPRLGERSVTSISARDLAELQGELVKKEISRKTVNNIMGLLKKILRSAVDWRYIEDHPGSSVKPLRIAPQAMRHWSERDQKKFLEWAMTRDRLIYEIVAVALYTGMRRGEMEALKRDCLNFEDKVIIVRRSVCSTTHEIRDHTKGKNIRMVPMNDVVLEILRTRERLPLDSLVLPCDYDHFVEKKFKPAQRSAGLENVINFHALRHTFGTQMASKGVPLPLVKMLMGHREIKTTMGYLHTDSKHLRGATDILLRG